MALTRISDNKWIDTAQIVAIQRASNNKGWDATLSNGHVFLTNDEYDKLGLETEEETP